MVTAVKLEDGLKGSARETLRFSAEIALVAQSEAELQALKLGPGWHVIRAAPDARVWTDDYSNVLDAILTKMRGPSPLHAGT